ncbi:MAG: sodium:proton exchanger [Rhodobacteraceae bacterium]|nr:MAG: sodium:proton exchanger [Paracoccaceae bacterium]
MEALIAANVFYEIAALLVIAAAVGLVGLLLRQPLIVSFIAVGVLTGPSVLGIAQSDQYIDLLAALGISVLLFMVGLKLDLSLVRSMGAVSLMTGLGQVAFTASFGFLICLALGLDPVTSIYVAVALTFSSTIIIVKLLSDKKEIDSLHGRVALGFLIVQDIVVVIAMIVLSALGVGADADAGLEEVLEVFGYGAGMLVAVGLFIRYVADPLTERLSRAPELLLSFSIGFAAFMAALGDFLGFGKELGGLLAGVALASTPFRDAIAARLAPLRDFLLLFFFIALGAALDLSLLGASVLPAVVLSLFVLIGNPLIVMIIMGLLGYAKRTGFLAGLTVAQISEFSLIFMAMGVTLGDVTNEALGLVTLVGLITIAASTYMITFSHTLYAWFAPFLGVFERREAHRDDAPSAHGRYDIVVFGVGRYGGAIAQRVRRAGWRVLGVDFNPQVVRAWREAGLDVIYGDATDPEFIADLPLTGARWAISAAPEHDTGVTHQETRAALISGLRARGFRGRIAVAVNREDGSEDLSIEGVDLTLRPFLDAADRAVEILLGAVEQEHVEPVETQSPQRELAS